MQPSRSGSWYSLISIGSGPIEFGGKRVETCCGVLEVCCFPNGASIGPSLIYSCVAIIAIIIARKGDIVRIDEVSFDYDLQGGVVCPACSSQLWPTWLTLPRLKETY